MITSDACIKYVEIRSRLDSEIAQLQQVHSHQMVCKKQCSLCCMNFGVLPIEAYAIAQELFQTHTPLLAHTVSNECIFLQTNMCTIYKNRPFICRTQGLPILYNVEQTYELSVCELNFTSVDDSYFTEKNCLFMDTYNYELQECNHVFIKQNQQLNIIPNTLISINDIPLLVSYFE